MASSPPKYLQQLDRVRRWHERFREISEGKVHDRPSDFYQDEVYAFFLNCYHLKDWIRIDPAASSLSGSVEAFITKTPELALCADICNGIKHLVSSKPRTVERPQFGRRNFKVGVGTQPTMIAIEYTIDTTSGPVDAFDLATRCVHAWEGFLGVAPAR
ncbi:MAG: hypothetical protein WD906_01645 [Anaerolineales bacterium]